MTPLFPPPKGVSRIDTKNSAPILIKSAKSDIKTDKYVSVKLISFSVRMLLSAPFVRTSFGARSFSVAAPKIWNSLPPSLRTCTSPDTLRRHFKTHYCLQAFQST